MMSDDFLKNFDLNEDNEKKPEPLGEEPKPLHEEPELTREASVQTFTPEPQTTYEQPVYTNPYINRATYRQSDGSAKNANPYVEQKTVDSASSVTSAAQEASKSDNTFNDGFYHQSYRDQSVGNHVNYTRPVTSVENSASYPYATRISSDSANRRKREKSGGLSKGGIAVLLAVCILISGAAGFGGSILASKLTQPQYDSGADSSMVIHKVNAETQVAGTEELVDKTTSEIASEVADSVVEITTEVMQTSTFYGQYIAQGAGSGVIISEDGYLLTNNHVIDGASSIEVTTRGGDSYVASLVGKDAELDIALLKIEATGLHTAVFGDSSTLTIGSKTVIIGNPLGTLGGSVTEGIISALDRAIAIDGKTMHLMQTDAAVNPGNSGGGMFNGQGELTGIVVAKSSSSSEDIDNIGFVIPINDVLDILGDLKDYGYVRGRAATGMTFIDLTNQMYAWYYYRNSEAGVYVSSVESGSNAETAGFRAGDRIVTMDGEEVSSSKDITAYMTGKSVGDTVTFEVERSGSKGTLELTLEEDVPDSAQNSNSFDSDNGGFSDGGNPFGGLFGR